MFSIVIPLYNKEKYIERTINSVLIQTFQEFEIIIVNDGSTDNSIIEVGKFNDNRIRIINQKNAGVSAARNRGINESIFKYVAFLDADDEWEEDYLETINKMIIKYPECQVYATNYKTIDKQGNEKIPVNTQHVKFAKTDDNKIGILEDYFDFASRTAPPLWTSAITCKKEAILSIKGFPINIKSAEDLITWAKLASRYKLCYTKENKSIYRIEIQNYQPGRMIDRSDFIERELIKLIPLCKSKQSIKNYLSLWFKMRASTFLRHNYKVESLKESLKSISYNYKNYKVYLYLVIIIMPKYLYKYIFK
jgi:glycosyltransferase involved in cell wall biosynthesis